jgi:hypothetical protein
VEKEVIKALMPKVEIKPQAYRLGAKDALAIGGLARIDVLSGKREFVYAYFANTLTYQRFPLEQADSKFFQLLQQKRLKPSSKKYQTLADFVTLEMTLPPKGRIDIAISGYGWLNFLAQGQTIRLLLPKGVLAVMLPSKVQS